ncbi:MAG: DUF2378 family protein [Myxococcota bacterium]
MGDPGRPDDLLAELRAEGVAEIRGTMLVSSLRAVEERGLAEAYRRRLPAAHLERIRRLSALAWYPMELADAHYGAIAALIEDEAEQVRIGRETAARVQGTFLGTLLRSLAVTGVVTPHRALTLAPKLLGRSLRGVGIRAERTGPQGAVVRVEGLQLLRLSYCRNTFRGWFEEGLGLVAKRVETRAEPLGEHAVAFTLRWGA